MRKKKASKNLFWRQVLLLTKRPSNEMHMILTCYPKTYHPLSFFDLITHSASFSALGIVIFAPSRSKSPTLQQELLCSLFIVLHQAPTFIIFGIQWSIQKISAE